jgi:hypothetical protein
MKIKIIIYEKIILQVGFSKTVSSLQATLGVNNLSITCIMTHCHV